MYRKLFENFEITPEMIRWFHKRTKAHINAVTVFAKRIYRNKKLRSFINGELFIKDILIHDKSKFEEPEYTPYIKLTWRHKLEGENKDYKKPGTLEKEDENMATLRHVKVNHHHPEYWSAQNNVVNAKDRDGIPDKIVDATKMPLTYIASMVADWMAMSKELKDNPYRWAEKNIGIRWKFSKEQVDFIYLILDEIWR